MISAAQSELGGKRITRIDGIRAIAVLAVFAFHTGFLDLGWMGVHMFFVLSGFLITGILRRSRSEPHFWGPFYIKRAARILPPLVIIFTAAAVFYKVYPWRGVGLLDLLFLGNVAQTLHPGADASLGMIWSLAVEEHFYLLWPFAIRFLDRKRILQILVAVIVLEPILRAVATPFCKTYVPIYNLTPFQLDGLAAGSFLALLIEDESSIPALRKYSGWCSLVSIVLLLTLYRFVPFFNRSSNSLSFNSVGYSLAIFFSAAFLMFVLLRPEAPVVRLVNHPWMVFIGVVSYGMYLFDPLTLVFGVHLGNMAGIHHNKLLTPLALALNILMAWVSFRFYETPIIQRGRRRARQLSRSNHPEPVSPLTRVKSE